jgi:hypothetical protein
MREENKQEVARQAMLKMADVEFRRLTCEQLISDAERAGIDLKLAPEMDTETILTILHNNLLTLEQRDTHAFFQWMYLLDLNERLVSKVLAEDPTMHLLASHVLERAAFKVFFRRYWKG